MSFSRRWFPKRTRLILLAGCLALGLALGLAWKTSYVRLVRLEVNHARHVLFHHRIYDEEDWEVFKDPSQATPVPCGEILGDRTMVALVLGQSNAANSVNERYTPAHDVFMYDDHVCYKARDPLLGASAPGGSLWSRLGDLLIERGVFDKVLFISIARRGSSIFNWGRRGSFSPLLRRTLANLKEDGIRVTHVLFHQGEADCFREVGQGVYGLLLESLITQTRQGLGRDVPFFVCQASRSKKNHCDDLLDPGCYKECPGILAAQAGVVDPARGILAGPNTDDLVPIAERPDGSHFSAPAADLLARDWAGRIARGQENLPSRPGP
jgi:hypothetical protein